MRLVMFILAVLLWSREGFAQSISFSEEELSKRTFHFFWDLADKNAQIPDRWPNLAFSSVAATGFGFSAYLVGVERGWITRQEAAERVLKSLEVLYQLPQGPAAEGVAGYRGFYYHFLDHQKSLRFKDVELSTIDSGLLLAGILSCQTYFDANTPIEEAIRKTADLIYRRVEWDWMLNANQRISMGWKPEIGFLQAEWFGYTEAMILYVLALGSPTHPIPAESWQSWCQNYIWDEFEGQEHVNFGPLFGHQYSHVWIDFKGIQDAYMRAKGIDYFENSRRATYANYAYCKRNPKKHTGYSEKTWGLTACDGPVDWLAKHDPKRRCIEDWERFQGYSARGASTDYRVDDGVIAPTAAGGSVPFAPEICLPALKNMWESYYDSLVGQYGFKDAFCPSFTACGQLPKGWFGQDYLGIDQGPILLMLENHRSGLIWNLMKRNPYIQRGLQRAGFQGAWLAGISAPPAENRNMGFNPDVPTNPMFYFDRRVYRTQGHALPYRLLNPANGLHSNAVTGAAMRTDGVLVGTDGKPLKLPLVVFLHGSGERGFDNEAPLRNGLTAFVEPAQWQKNPCFILAPQCPADGRWSGSDRFNVNQFRETPTAPMKLLISLIEKTIRENPAIDPDRIYLTGLSMGGSGVWDLLARRPELFAAALPLCGGGDPALADRMKNIPIWVFHGRRDDTVPTRYSRQMVEALMRVQAPVQYTEYETLGHAIWQETYYNPLVTAWLFQHKRKK